MESDNKYRLFEEDQETQIISYNLNKVNFHKFWCNYIFIFLIDTSLALLKLGDVFTREYCQSCCTIVYHIGYFLVHLGMSFFAPIIVLLFPEGGYFYLPISMLILIGIISLMGIALIIIYYINRRDWQSGEMELACTLLNIFGIAIEIAYQILALITHNSLGNLENIPGSEIARVIILVNFFFVTWPFLLVLSISLLILVLDLIIALIRGDFCRKVPKCIFRSTINQFSLPSTDKEAVCVYCKSKITSRGVRLGCHPDHCSHKSCLESQMAKLNFCPLCVSNNKYSLVHKCHNNSIIDPQQRCTFSVSISNIECFIYSNTSHCIFCCYRGTLFKLSPNTSQLLEPVISGIQFFVNEMYEYQNCLYLFNRHYPCQVFLQYDILKNKMTVFPPYPDVAFQTIFGVSHYLVVLIESNLLILDLYDTESGWVLYNQPNLSELSLFVSSFDIAPGKHLVMIKGKIYRFDLYSKTFVAMDQVIQLKSFWSLPAGLLRPAFSIVPLFFDIYSHILYQGS